MNTAMIDGKRYVLVPEPEYNRLVAGVKVEVPEDDLPPWPKQLPGGKYPAVQTARVSMARRIITERRQLNLSQAELARRAGITPAVLNRIEKAKVSADSSTINKIDAAFKGAAKKK